MTSNIKSLLQKSEKKYKLLDKIGSGAYGMVFKGLRDDDKKWIALKRVFIKEQDGGCPLSTHRELNALKKLSNYSPYIVSLYDVIPNKVEDRLCVDLIFELMPYDLEQFIKEFYDNSLIPMNKILTLSKQLAEGIYFMHKNQVIHRDLKPANILVDENGNNLKITDFGLARIFGFDASLTPDVVTLWYRPPEVLLHNEYSFPVDIWSAGCIIAEMVYGKAIFAGDNELKQLESIIYRLGDEVINNWPEKMFFQLRRVILSNERNIDFVLRRADRRFSSLIKDMLRFKPTSRIVSSNLASQLKQLSSEVAGMWTFPPLSDLSRSHSTITSSSLPQRIIQPGHAYANGNSDNCSGQYQTNQQRPLVSGRKSLPNNIIETQSELVNSVVRNVLNDDDYEEEEPVSIVDDGLPASICLPEIELEPIQQYPHEEVEISEEPIMSLPYVQEISDEEPYEARSGGLSSSLNITEYSGDETDIEHAHVQGKQIQEHVDVQVSREQQKESDEIGDSFSSYRSQNDTSFSSYAPSSHTDEEEEDDDAGNNHLILESPKQIDALFENDFLIADEGVARTASKVHYSETVLYCDENTVSPASLSPIKTSSTDKLLSSSDKPFCLKRKSSTPLKELNTNSPPAEVSQPLRHLQVRKRVLSGVEESSMETHDMNNRGGIIRQPSIRRRLHLGTPLDTTNKSPGASGLTRSASVMVGHTNHTFDCSFGERSLARALPVVAAPIRNSTVANETAILSDRPKILVRRHSQMVRK